MNGCWKKDESTEGTISPEEALSFNFRQTEKYQPPRCCKFSLSHSKLNYIKHPGVYVIRSGSSCKAQRVYLVCTSWISCIRAEEDFYLPSLLIKCSGLIHRYKYTTKQMCSQ